MNVERNIEDIIETLKDAKRRGKKCSVLIGAGCSDLAGIPTAKGFVEVIKERFPTKYKRASEKSYPKCMDQLSIEEQRDLIAEFVDKANINWAHIALAQLMKAQFVDRVLTTNFDLLLVRACALINQFPAVYDFATSQVYKPEKIPEKAIIYLHGQRTGFVLINTPEEFEEHSKLLDPVFDDAGRGRIWLVVGYSGKNDPVFEQLAKVNRFDGNLYWVGFLEEDPPKHVRERLLIQGKDAFYVRGFDADSFFVTLAQELECFPPELVGQPFSHLRSILDTITPYTYPKTSAKVNFLDHAQNFIQRAIEYIEPVQTGVIESWADFMRGDYEKVIGLQKIFGKSMHPEMKKVVCWAYCKQGDLFTERALGENAKDKGYLFEKAIKKYELALELMPNFFPAMNNCGTTYFYLEELGDENDEIIDNAIEKFEAADKLFPNSYETIHSWGSALYIKAKKKKGIDADRLYESVYEKYAASIKINPDGYSTFRDWGTALIDQAKIKSGKEADYLYDEAYKKFQTVLQKKPDMSDVLATWGTALFEQAKNAKGKKADELYAQVYEKYKDALKLVPDDYITLSNWGSALSSQANTKSGDEADKLFKEAFDKYEAAIKIEPNDYQSLIAWGIALFQHISIKESSTSMMMAIKAKENFETAFEINPDEFNAYAFWGNVLNYLGMKDRNNAVLLFNQACEKFEIELQRYPDGYSTLNNWGDALFALAQMASANDKEELLMLAEKKYKNAIKIKPDYMNALHNWGALLMYSAKNVNIKDREKLIEKAKMYN